MIEAVTPQMISDFVRQLLSSKPSLAAFGDGAEGVSYDQLLARYGRHPQQGAVGGGGGGGVFSRLFGRAGTAAALGHG
jgi:hypothetical protein